MNSIDTSVVMITWCIEDYRLAVLRQSFESLKKCTEYPHSLVVVDNGSAPQREYLNSQQIDFHIINEVNKGVGVSRNMGAEATQSEFIAFVDNDIEYVPGWLGECVNALKRYPDRRLIASAVKNKPMTLTKYQRGRLDGYELFSRAAGMCLVVRRRTWKEFGKWSISTNPGHKFCHQARRKGYQFIWKQGWDSKHLTTKPCYHYKRQVFIPETGQWINKKKYEKSLQESTT